MPAKRPTFPVLELRRIRQELADGNRAAAYLLLGSDRYLKDLVVDAVREQAGDNCRRVRVTPDESFDALLEDLGTNSMWGEETVALVLNAEKLAQKDNKRRGEQLQQYLQQPAPWATLVLDFDDGELTATARKFLEALTARCATYTCRDLTEEQVGSWVARRLGKNALPTEAVRYLHRQTQGKAHSVDMELNKLELVAADGAPVTLNDCLLLVTSDEIDDPFEVTNAIEQGSEAKAIQALHHTLERNQEPFRLLAQLGTYVRTLQQVTAGLARGDDPKTIAQTCGLNPWRTEKIAKLVRRQRPGIVRRLVQSVALADRRIKRGADPLLILERLVSGLARSVRPAR